MALFQFIQSFFSILEKKPNLTVLDFYDHFRKKLPPNFALVNQDTLILFLWGLVALPKETFLDHIPSVNFKSLPNSWGKWSIETWELKKWETSRDLKSFVCHIRNSINHGRFSNDHNLKYTFEDRRDDNSPINFRVHAYHDSILRFSKSLGDGYVMNKWPK
jgi:hypothetical protein